MPFGSSIRRLLGRDRPPPDDGQETSFRKVVEQSPDVICRVVNGQFRYVSPSALTMFGWGPQDLISTDGMHTIYPDDQHIVIEVMGKRTSEQSRSVCQIRVVCQDTSLKWVETTAHNETNNSITETVLVMRDITDRKKLEEQLAAMAFADGLTGLANRRAFDQALDREWKRTLRSGGQMALLLLDIDFFKQFNDLYGHQAGDDCLRSVAAGIKELSRRPTDLACRYGGEEIAVIFSDISLDATASVAEEMRSRVAALGIPHRSSGCADHITVSIGIAAAIARIGGTIGMPEGLLQAADHALYKAKAAGRNRVEQAILMAPSDL